MGMLETMADPYKERSASFRTRSTCGSSSSIQVDALADPDREAIHLPRASFNSVRSWRASKPIREERLARPRKSSLSDVSDDPCEDDDEHAIEASSESEGAATLFTSSSIRVLKQVAPSWANLFLPRFVRLQSGTRPYLEYTRQKEGEVRQRVFLTTATLLVREPKHKLLIEFVPTPTSDKGSKQSREEGDGSSPKHQQWRLRFETKRERDVWYKKIQDAIDMLAWIGKYRLGDVIMETDTSTLVECFSWMDESKPSYVMKVINTNKHPTLNVRNELRLHHSLTNFTNHPQILTLHDAFRSNDRACLVIDYCAGGDLFEYLRVQGRLEEATAKALFRLIAQAIVYVHEHKIVHLDIKPENLLFKSLPRHLRSIKLADFGSAQSVATQRAVRHVSYTVGYAAPEVLLRREVSYAADVFSAGAVLFTMLCGYAPFQSSHEDQKLQKNMHAEYCKEASGWGRLSSSAQDLLHGMLQEDPAQRLTMSQVLEHAWLREGM